jgi:3-oxoacyl-[acyl-carrier protein] reductase
VLPANPELVHTTVKPKLALITGGKGGLATELCSRLSAAGYEVEAPGRADLDVTKADAVTEFINGLDRVDLLINNAGVTRDRSLLKMDESEWDEVLAVNAKGAFLCASRVLRKMMRQRSGHIVNTGSYSALRPPHGQANYAAAKAALVGLTQSLAAEAGSRGVRVNCVLPGFLETPMTEKLSTEVKSRALQAHALGRFNSVADAARFIVFLDSMEAVSGQVFQLDSRVRSWC